MMRLHTDERGVTMITVLGILMMLGLLGTAMVSTSTQDMNISDNFKRDTQALYAAEAGCEYGLMQFTAIVDSTDRPPVVMPEGTFTLGHQTVRYFVSKKPGGPVTRTLSSGTYRGLYALVEDYDIWGQAESDATAIANAVRVRMEHALIPIFQFAIFYDDDLEWHPGPVMNLSGRVHSNKNLYLGSNSGLTIDSYVTAAGELHHGRHPASGQVTGSGYVRIKDQNSVDQDMKNIDGTWLDHGESNWAEESQNRWGGQVKDVEHGIETLDLPLETSKDPYNIIKDATGGNSDSYENLADLRIINGKASFRSGGSWVDVTADMIADGSLNAATFYDAREGKTVTSLDIDINWLNKSKYWPPNGILYTKSVVGAYPATRLINGTKLLTGLTVASENPVYTLGDYNTFKKQPAAILTDAYTILSNAWTDAASAGALSGRNASNTTVNVSFISGNVESVGGKYSGGVENFPRFLENWSGRTLSWKGSMVQLWQSQQATNAWSYGVYYTAPNRDWNFDLDLLDPANLPPGTPVVHAIIRQGWLNSDGLADARP